LPGWNQVPLKDSIVLLAGIGGLGTEIAKNLAMAGVGTLHLIDMDTIEHSNLNRQILFLDGDEGEPKAVIAARMLKRINPHGTYHAYHTSLEELDPVIYEQADLYIAGLDSVKARQELNRRAVLNAKPLIDGGTSTYHGHIYSYIPKQNACLNCDPMREREVEDLAACTLVGIPRRRNHCLLKGQLYFESNYDRLPLATDKKEVEIVLNYANDLAKEHFPEEGMFTIDDVVKAIDHHEPAIITINAIISSIQSQDALRILHHLKNTKLGMIPMKYTIYNGLTSSFYQFDKPQNHKCETCGELAPLVADIHVRPKTTFDEILHIIKTKGYNWDPEFPPLFWKVDVLEMEEIDLNATVIEMNIRAGETIMVSGIEVPDSEVSTMYLRLRF
ncbi:MAG: HesA/MoeB/ThiF family protein, partial [Candidatus Kariarchaeaceae archaeon]